MLKNSQSSLTLITAALILALTGCAPAGTGTPSGSPTADTPSAMPTQASPSPSAPPEEPTAASIKVSTTSVAILDEDGAVMSEFEYFDDSVEPVVEALTEAFGSGPVVETVDGGVHRSWVEHTWGGFAVWDYTAESDQDFAEDWKGASYPEVNSFRVVVQSAAEGGIAIATKDGIAVGDDANKVAAVSFRDHLDTGGTKDIHFYRFDRIYVEPKVDKGDDDFRYFAGTAWVDPTSKKVYRIDSPGRNWGH